MTAILIRKCEAEDLPAVSALMHELSEVAQSAAEFRLSALETIYREMVQFPGIYLNLVALVEGQIVGFLSLLFYRTFFHRVGSALINELVVTQELRGHGVGTALVQRAREEAVARGMDELEVSTETSNARAQQFYQKCGFDTQHVLLEMDLPG